LSFAQLPDLDRWKTKPQQLIIAVIAFSVLLGGALVGGHRMLTGLEMTPEALAEARTGTIIVPSKDGRHCEEIKFHNDTGAFTAGKPSWCGAPKADDTQFGSIRGGFRGN
jgi:hypothetical protein